MDESGYEKSSKKIKEDSLNRVDKTTPATKVEDEVEKDELKTENEDPKPSTSSQSIDNEDFDVEEKKRYKQSFAFIQFHWCKQQPDFIKLRQELLEKHE